MGFDLLANGLDGRARAEKAICQRFILPQQPEKQMFAFSILYLFLLFAVLLIDRLSGGFSVQAMAHIAG